MIDYVCYIVPMLAGPVAIFLPLFSDEALIRETVLETAAQLIRTTTMAKLPLFSHVVNIVL